MGRDRPLIVLSQDNITIECRINLSHLEVCSFVFFSPQHDKLTFFGVDYFECLSNLRLYLERVGSMPLCAGARFDVYPSGMTRSMFRGELAYITRMGEASGNKDRVNIFDYAAPQTVGTIAQQEEFHKRWANSLGILI